MREIIELLPFAPATTERLRIAKGKFFFPKGLKDIHRINKQLNGYG